MSAHWHSTFSHLCAFSIDLWLRLIPSKNEIPTKCLLMSGFFFWGGGIFLGCGGGFPMSSLHHRKLFSLWCFWPKQIPLISLINGAILFTDFWLRGLWTMSATGIFQKCKKCKVFGITDHLKLRNCVRWKIFFFYFMSFNEQHLNPELVIHKCCNLYS